MQQDRTTSGPEVWIVSADDGLHRVALTELDGTGLIARHLVPGAVATPEFWRGCRPLPAVVLFDVSGDPRWGRDALEAMRRARVRVPVVAVSDAFTHEFGTEVVSRGVSYCLLRDFAPGEMREVVTSLIRTTHDRATRS